MAPVAILFGVALSALGGILFFLAGFDWAKFTSLIPAFFGIALIILGILASNEKLRMHVMHVAALLGLIGFAFPAVMVIRASTRDNFDITSNSAWGQIAMSALCFVFLALCVKSFIDARIARKAKEAAEQKASNA